MPAPAHDLDDFGDLVRTARLATLGSQAALAKAIGIKQTYMSDIERGRIRDLPASLLDALSRVLGIDRETLVAAAVARFHGTPRLDGNAGGDTVSSGT